MWFYAVMYVELFLTIFHLMSYFSQNFHLSWTVVSTNNKYDLFERLTSVLEFLCYLSDRTTRYWSDHNVITMVFFFGFPDVLVFCLAPHVSSLSEVWNDSWVSGTVWTTTSHSSGTTSIATPHLLVFFLHALWGLFLAEADMLRLLLLADFVLTRETMRRIHRDWGVFLWVDIFIRLFR